ncbi:amidohydrolase family protein [Methylobacterium oryzae CBMB20]
MGRPDPDFAGPVWRAHLARVADLGWQIEVQAEARRLARLLPPLVAAGVPVVVDHFGRIDPALGIADPGFADLLGFGRGGRVWVKLSGAYRIGSGEAGRQTALQAAERLRGAFGARRLLWGSDWPHTQFEDPGQPGRGPARPRRLGAGPGRAPDRPGRDARRTLPLRPLGRGGPARIPARTGPWQHRPRHTRRTRPPSRAERCGRSACA